MSQWDYKIDQPMPEPFPFPSSRKGPGIEVGYFAACCASWLAKNKFFVQNGFQTAQKRQILAYEEFSKALENILLGFKYRNHKFD